VPATGAWFTVVGVVASVHDTSLAAPPTGILYLPDVADPDSNRSPAARIVGLTVRTNGDPRALSTVVQRAILGVDRSLPAFNVEAMGDVVGESLARLTFVMVLLAIVAGVALTLAAVGLYGVIAYVVSLRTKEIGVRIALGAQPAGVSRMVARQGVALAAAGVIAGTAVFLFVTRFLGAWIAGVGNVDATTLAIVAGLLLAVALCASWLPARRAAQVDPIRALGGTDVVDRNARVAVKNGPRLESFCRSGNRAFAVGRDTRRRLALRCVHRRREAGSVWIRCGRPDRRRRVACSHAHQLPNRQVAL
jgi:hypothetical protein